MVLRRVFLVSLTVFLAGQTSLSALEVSFRPSVAIPVAGYGTWFHAGPGLDTAWALGLGEGWELRFDQQLFVFPIRGDGAVMAAEAAPGLGYRGEVGPLFAWGIRAGTGLYGAALEDLSVKTWGPSALASASATFSLVPGFGLRLEGGVHWWPGLSLAAEASVAYEVRP